MLEYGRGSGEMWQSLPRRLEFVIEFVIIKKEELERRQASIYIEQPQSSNMEGPLA